MNTSLQSGNNIVLSTNWRRSYWFLQTKCGNTDSLNSYPVVLVCFLAHCGGVRLSSSIPGINDFSFPLNWKEWVASYGLAPFYILCLPSCHLLSSKSLAYLVCFIKGEALLCYDWMATGSSKRCYDTDPMLLIEGLVRLFPGIVWRTSAAHHSVCSHDTWMDPLISTENIITLFTCVTINYEGFYSADEKLMTFSGALRLLAGTHFSPRL